LRGTISGESNALAALDLSDLATMDRNLYCAIRKVAKGMAQRSNLIGIEEVQMSFLKIRHDQLRREVDLAPPSVDGSGVPL